LYEGHQIDLSKISAKGDNQVTDFLR